MNKLITLKELADGVGVVPQTLRSWLGHYSLTKFLKPVGLRIFVISYSEEFKSAFNNYLKIRCLKGYKRQKNYYLVNFNNFVKTLAESKEQTNEK